MPLGIDPTVDYAFKRLFGVPENSDLLIHLLNAVLKPATPIVAVEILNPLNYQEFAEDKLSILDVKARDGDGALYNIEMQAKAQAVMRHRLPYYNAKLYTGQLSEGEDYKTLAAAITVCFLEGVLFPGVGAPHLSFTLCDCRQQVQLTDLMQIHTIELPKYNFNESTIGSADPLDQWSFFLSHAAEFDATELKVLLPDRTYAKATGVMEMISHSPQERAMYEARRKAELDYKSFLTAARQEGRQEGRQVGHQEGRKEAIVSQVQRLQRISKLPTTAESELMAMEIEALQKLCDEMEARLTTPNQNS